MVRQADAEGDSAICRHGLAEQVGAGGLRAKFAAGQAEAVVRLEPAEGTWNLDAAAVVGAHWFQYADQPVTGRFDAENYQIGFVDIADTPYPETIAASREIGAALYDLRAATR